MKYTLFFVLSLIAILALIVSSIIMMNQNGMDQRLQGIVNLLWLPLPVLILIIDRICIKKYELKEVNKIEFYIVGSLILLFLLNWGRLRLQS